MTDQSEIQATAESIVSTLNETDEIDDVPSVDEVVEKLKGYTDYSIPISDAKRDIIDDYDIDDTNDPSSSTVVSPSDVSSDGEYVTFEKVKVIDTWSKGNYKQKGTFADEEDTINYIIFNDSSVESFSEGDVVRVEGVQTDEYQGSYSVKLFDSTNVEHLDEDINTEKAGVEEGLRMVVNISDQSGLIRRCAESEDCSRVVSDECPEHGDGETEFDVRIKGHLDSGDSVFPFYVTDEDLFEDLTGFDQSDMEELFEENNYRMSATVDPIREKMFFNYYKFVATEFDGNLMIDTMEEVDRDIEPSARSIHGNIPVDPAVVGGEN